MSARILYIEDNEANMYLVNYILNARGHEVLQAWDGMQGVELATNELPDLILLDIQLPGMDGYETARRIRAKPGLVEVPIVALTSYAMAGDKEKALAAGCDGYIEKPINPDTFLSQIESFIVRRP
jgi:two-component system, cell cycle response regulator DivK